MSDDPQVYEWEQLLDDLRPLGEAMRQRLPERLRGDPHVRQEAVRLLLAGLLRTTNDAIAQDRAHPMFVPELNLIQNIFQPNADTIYKAALIGKGGTYRMRGQHGDVRMMVMAQLGPDTLRTGQHHPALDTNDFKTLPLDADGRFDVIISPERPAGWTGHWWMLNPACEKFMLRIVGCRWGEEREPRFGIDRLDTPAAKGRPSLAELAARFAEIPFTTQTCALAFPDKVEKMRNASPLNTLNVVDFSQMSGLQRQSYYEGAYDLAEDEALITEVAIPDEVGYWSLILTNELVRNDRLGITTSRASTMRRRWSMAIACFRAVISARDPGVHNWLDTSGYPRGAIQGRWFDTDARPTPTAKVVKLADVSAHLPADTRRVTPEERDALLRDRRIGGHMRTLW